jgi:integrase
MKELPSSECFALNLANLVRSVIQPALDNAEDGPVKWLGWHSFRRGLGSNLYAVGVALAIIQRIRRHSSVSTTMDFYVVTEDKKHAKHCKRSRIGENSLIFGH